ncbi:hypothetical protein [Salipiger abyssi]|uniref:hypothetical protein n=1 Tax=Salipiger abyssi TaxID=1250539 RepID=UPI001A90A2BE|nr:hypothetical protein [Salipiger abyssi]MBN9890117.1 hypothetical protein [Salipiger abyssi]
MGVRKVGFKRVQKMMEELPETTGKHLEQANEDNADEWIRVAKILVPVGETGRAKAAIRTTKQGKGQLMDFGPLSSILEGGTQERFHKSGKGTGKGPKLPFVRPAERATEDARNERLAKALRDAVTEAKKNGGS